MANYNLTNQAIEDSFQPLLQIDSGSALRDGTGSLVDNIIVTSSYAITASHALNVGNPEWDNIQNKPSGLVSGSSQVSFNGITDVPSGLVSGSSQIVLEDVSYTDNGADSFLTTDGAGNLSFQYVESLYQNIRNMESISIFKGTPLFVDGQTGDNANVYIADAGNPNRFPATLIAGDTELTPSSTGKGLISGKINNVNTNLYPAGTEVYLGVGGGWTATRPTGSAQVQILGVVTRQGNNGEGVFINQLQAHLPNIQQGYAWVGNSDGVPEAVATSSFSVSIDTGSLVTTSSFNAYTQSNDSKVNSLINSTGSYLITASTDFSEITFTKNDTSQFTLDTTPKQVVALVRSKEGFLSKGIPVYASGSTGNAFNVYRAVPNDLSRNRFPASFILKQGLALDEEGIGIHNGIFDDIDTSTLIEGKEVYVKANGGLTSTRPTGSVFIQKVGYTLKSSSNGSLLITDMGNFNDLPNISSGSLWIGNNDGTPIEIQPTSLFLSSSLVSRQAESNVIYNPQLITQNITIPTNKNAFIIGPVTISGDFTIDTGSELYIHSPADLDGYLTKGQFNPISASFDTRINDVPKPLATTGSNTFNGNQIVSGSIIAKEGLGVESGFFEVGNINNYPNGTVNLGVYGTIILRSGSGIQTDGAFGPDIPFDSPVTFFQGTSHQNKPANNIQFLGLEQQGTLPNFGNPGLAVSGSNLYFYDGTQWKQVNLT